MFRIEREKYGYRLTLGGNIKGEEMNRWLEESKKILETAKPGFGVFVDMRTLEPLPEESQRIIETGQKYYKKKGMVRSVVILSSDLLTMQFIRLAQQSGIYKWERYINADHVPDWEKVGEKWITEGSYHEVVEESR
ncbi:MAG: hypothetical protein JW814_12425 [Candidatus Krumholzibacteriota bacterium]|nr:hypothetical protein [Candidatus Krumholzibacteriota bacterium]